MICVSIGELSVKKCLGALKGLNFAEIRIDKIRRFPAGSVPKIFSRPLRLIATCRPGILDDATRKRLLTDAIEAGAAFVDIEIESSKEYKKEIIEKAKAHRCKVIISFHNYIKMPKKAELNHIIKKSFKAGANIVKIACKVRSEKENAELLGLLDSTNKNVVVVGMGKKGIITRIIAPLLGSPFTYASVSKGKETAEGQLDKNTIKRIMENLKSV
ncbi:MAG: type I 3-dehydroquinate dehydratase [Planctomycetota bacterium]